MSHITLHQFPHSHFCIRIRWALALKGMPFETKNYMPSTIDEVEKLTGGYRAVPVLQWEKQYITDSPNIARFLESKKEAPTLYPGNATPELCDMVNGWVDAKVFPSAARFLVGDLLRFLPKEADRKRYRARFEAGHGMSPEAAMTKQAEWEKELNTHWSLLEEQLSQQSYLLGEKISYADLGVASRLRLMEMVGNYAVPGNFPVLRSWYRGIRLLAD